MKELSEFSINPRTNLTDKEIIDVVFPKLRNYRVCLSIEPEKLPQEKVVLINNAISDTVSWLEDRLGFDASKRIPKIDQIKFFKEENWSKVLKAQNRNDDVAGLMCFNDILILDARNQNEMLDVLYHELAHYFSRKSVYSVREGEKINTEIISMIGFSGYKKNNFVYGWLNEIMTEMIKLEILSSNKNCKNNRVLHNLLDTYSLNGIIFMDMIFDKMGEKLGKDQLDIRNTLYSSYFDGSMANLRIIKDTFGVNSLRTISKLKNSRCPSEYLSHIGQKYFEIDGDQYERKVQILEQKQELLLTNGIRIKIA